MGATRWIKIGGFQIQPSEFMKVSLTLLLARWFARVNPDRETGLKELIIPSIITAIPVLLIVLEPDLGTGVVVILIFLMMAFYRRLKWKTIGIIALLGFLSGTAMYQFGLKEYQRKRISTFPESYC